MSWAAQRTWIFLTASAEEARQRAIHIVRMSLQMFQKIEIVFQNPEATYTMTELEEIAYFYNQIKRDTWTEIGQIPDEKNDICAITTYQLERHTLV